MGRQSRLDTQIKMHDRQLYCARDREGRLCVFRNSTRLETFHLDDGVVLEVARPTPYFVFALTHNWKANGNPVDWGVEPVLARLKAIDLWNRDLASEIIEEAEKGSKAKERDLDNSLESFLYEFRSDFKKTFKDVNTANMAKKDLRRQYEKRVKQ